jgi:hypothetical protein
MMRIGRTRNRAEPVKTGKIGPLRGADGTTLALRCWNLLEYRAESTGPVANIPQPFGSFACKWNRT